MTTLENDIGQQSRLLNAVIDQWRYNGQIIGREISLYLTEEDGEQGFAMRLICPEQDSLLQMCIRDSNKGSSKLPVTFQRTWVIKKFTNAPMAFLRSK